MERVSTMGSDTAQTEIDHLRAKLATFEAVQELASKTLLEVKRLQEIIEAHEMWCPHNKEKEDANKGV